MLVRGMRPTQRVWMPSGGGVGQHLALTEP
jgi:hypothetical protein